MSVTLKKFAHRRRTGLFDARTLPAADVMPREYRSIFTKKLETNSGRQPKYDLDAVPRTRPSSFLAKQLESRPGSVREASIIGASRVKQEAEDPSWSFGEPDPIKMDSSAYSSQAENSEENAIGHRRQTSGSARGLRRFVPVRYGDDKPAALNSTEAFNPFPEPQPRHWNSRSVSDPWGMKRDDDANRVPQYPPANLTDFVPAGPPPMHEVPAGKKSRAWLFCGLLFTLMSVGLLGFCALAGGSNAILEALWLAEMKKQGLLPPYYRVSRG